MAKQEKKVYWTGAGVVRIAGVSYGYGKEIPVEGIDEKTLEKWARNGDISDAPVKIEKGASAAKENAQLKALKRENTTLRNQLEKANEDLKAKGKGDVPCKACESRDKKIEALKDQIEKAAKDNESLEDDVKEKAARINELEAQVEELTKPKEGGK